MLIMCSVAAAKSLVYCMSPRGRGLAFDMEHVEAMRLQRFKRMSMSESISHARQSLAICCNRRRHSSVIEDKAAEKISC